MSIDCRNVPGGAGAVPGGPFSARVMNSDKQQRVRHLSQNCQGYRKGSQHGQAGGTSRRQKGESHHKITSRSTFGQAPECPVQDGQHDQGHRHDGDEDHEKEEAGRHQAKTITRPGPDLGGHDAPGGPEGSGRKAGTGKRPGRDAGEDADSEKRGGQTETGSRPGPEIKESTSAEPRPADARGAGARPAIVARHGQARLGRTDRSRRDGGSPARPRNHDARHHGRGRRREP
jgi:hypothetical protein